MHTTHTDRSQPRGGSHISHAENNKNMQLEIDQLKRELHHAKRKRTSSNFDDYSGDEQDVNYRRRSRTPPSESFYYKEEYYQKRQSWSPSRRGVGNDTMSKALNQISRSPFTCKIEEARLPSRFCHAPNPIPGFVTMTDMLISSLYLILTRTNLTFNKTFTEAFLFL